MIEDISEAEAGRRAAEGMRNGTIPRCSQWTPKGPCKLPMNHGFAHDGLYGPGVNYGGHPWDDDEDDIPNDEDPSDLARRVLKCRMIPNDALAATVKDYLLGVLEMLWDDPPGFNGKRPYGYSSWQNDVYKSLGKAGLIEIEFDRDGDLEDVDDERGAELIIAAIQSLRLPKKDSRAH